MPRADSHGPGFRVDGLYERVRAAELRTALSPDPRLSTITDPDERERVTASAPKYAPAALGQTEALLARQPVRVPRSYIGGRTCPEVRDWPPYRDRAVRWFAVGPDDVLSPLTWTATDRQTPANGFWGGSEAGLGQTCGSNQPRDGL
jgi:hypothetical protein